MLMFNTRKRFILSGKHSVFTNTTFFLVLFIVILVLVIGSVAVIRRNRSFLPSISDIYSDWERMEYQSVYDKTGLILNKKPLDGSVLALNGFSSFYLYAAQTDPSLARGYLAHAISSLRNAWYRVSESDRPMIAYVLGKSYYLSGYYYSDLAVQYLEYARNSGVHFADLSEFRGLSYALYGDYETAIESFSEALTSNKSDLLLFSLAQTYLKTKNFDMSKQYFSEVLRTSADEVLQLKCRNELAKILLEENDWANAEREFNAILEKDVNFADAHYGLGVIYEAQGDIVKARASWRKSLRIDPVHQGAREKLKI